MLKRTFNLKAVGFSFLIYLMLMPLFVFIWSSTAVPVDPVYQNSLYTPTQSEDQDLPSVVQITSQVPQLDGNLTSFEGEWDDAVAFSVDSVDSTSPADLLVKTTGEKLYISLSFRLDDSLYLSAVEENLTERDLAVVNHTSIAIAFNRNFASGTINEVTGTFVNTGSASPDDWIALDYLSVGAVDASNGGSDNSSTSVDTANNVEFSVSRDFDSVSSTWNLNWELSKDLRSGDIAGADINLIPGAVVPIGVHWLNVENGTFEIAENADWNSIQIDRGIYDRSINSAPEGKNILIVYSDADSEFDFLEESLRGYGFNVDSFIGTLSLNGSDYFDYDLTIGVGDESLLHNQSGANFFFDSFAAGKPVILALSPQDSDDFLNEKLNSSGIQQSSGQLVQGNLGAQTSSFTVDLTSNNFNLSNLDSESYLLGAQPSTVTVVNSGYFTVEGGYGEGVRSGQRSNLYSLYDIPEDLYVDANLDNIFSEGEELTSEGNRSIALGFEGQFGSRRILFSSADMFNNTYLSSTDNSFLLLNSIQWCLRTERAIGIQEFDLELGRHNVNENIPVSVKVLDNATQSSLSDVDVYINVLVLQKEVQRVKMELSSNNTYIANFSHDSIVAVNVRIEAYSPSYGYQISEQKEILVVGMRLTPTTLHWSFFILFIVSTLTILGAIFLLWRTTL